MVVANEFKHLLSLTRNHERSWNDPALPEAEKDFFENNLKAARKTDAEAAYFIGFARVRHGLGTKYLNWKDIDKLLTRHAEAGFAPLHWLGYHFYGFVGEGEINNPNPFIDKKKAWQELEKAISLKDGHSMYEKAQFLNIMGASEESIAQAADLLQSGIYRGSRAATYLNGVWWVAKNGAYKYNEEAAHDFLERAAGISGDPYYRDDYIEKDALFELGKLYLSASSTLRDEERGVATLRAAAKAGHVGAAAWLIDYDHKNKAKTNTGTNTSPMSFFINGKAKIWKEGNDLSSSQENRVINFKSAMHALDDMVGLQEIKRNISGLIYQERAMNLRRAKGLVIPARSYHMVFSGAPGTGKTELAKRMGRIFKDLGILPTDKVHIVTRATLVGEYIGHTAGLVRKAVKEATGGILFIDEAYGLNPTSENDFGHEAIQTLLYEMEEKRQDLVVIAAGYPDMMKEFLRSNPGFASRFSYNFELPNYSEKELARIFQSFCRVNDYSIDEKTEHTISDYFKAALRKRAHRFANAREVRVLFEKAVERQSKRVVESNLKSKKSLKEIRLSDLPLENGYEDGNVRYLPSDKKQD